jgi:Raf kinase inhibitor-like YbhB/YbcL family protein
MFAAAACVTFMPLAAFSNNGGMFPKKGDSDMPKTESKLPTIELRSESFANGDTIPAKHSCDGRNLSPKLSWSNIPDSARELVLICDDPDAPSGTWVHWVLYGLSPDSAGLPEDIPQKDVAPGVRQGRNDFRKMGYGGPCPPRGPAHRYFFRLYAIDKQLDLKPGATKAEVMKAIEGHIVASGELMGLYKRQ